MAKGTPATTQQRWHALNKDEAISVLGSSYDGLTQAEAERRLAQFGPNELQEAKKINPFLLFIEQFKDILMIILMVAVVISAVIGEFVDALVIFAILMAAGGLGFFQEYRAERAMEALKRMAAPITSVLRDGHEVRIPTREVVPGDVVILHAGDRVPADCRLLEAINLQADEAPLTGESVPVAKQTAPILAEEVAVGDRTNMAFMGTAATYGRGRGMVVGTGMATEFGKIAQMLQQVEGKETPLEIELDRVGKWLGIGCLVVCGLVALLGLLRGHELLEMLIWGISLAIAAVPEALPAVVTISLAIGVQRMVKRHALIRKLPAVETLGCTTFICSDKTGTLTQNEMTVRRIYANGQGIEVSGVGYEPKGEFRLDGRTIDPSQSDSLRILLLTGTLCNDSTLEQANGTWVVRGDPTEGALVVLAAKAGLWQDKLNQEFPRVDEVPFSSERKRMTTIHTTPKGKVAYSKGAPEVILESCTLLYQDGQAKPLTPSDREQILGEASNMATNALRVLGLAYKPLAQVVASAAETECEMVFAGLVGMIDPPREEVKEAIRSCDRGGIKSVMITGDHKVTAMAIGSELGMLKKGIALSGAELDALDDKDFDDMAQDVEVYARVSPAHKLRVVQALQKKGHIVAMTGDGVNDAPALKTADIGVAMGITGTDVSKEASAMVLTDDNFASIVAAVEEGRGLFGNIKKYLMYLLSCNVGEILIMLVAGLIGGTLPVVAIHLLWINLVTDGAPALALAIDPADPDIMEQPPRDPKKSVFSKNILILIGVLAVAMASAVLPFFYWRIATGVPLEEAQTMAFTTIVMFEVFVVFSCRSERHSIFKLGFHTNRWLVYAVLSSLALQMVVLYVPFLQDPFHTVTLDAIDWAIVIGVALFGFVAMELAKVVMGWFARPGAQAKQRAS